MIRAVILSATIAALVTLWTEPTPKPIQSVQVDYCLIEYKAAQKHPLTGEWMTGWAQGYGPCALQDKYFFI